MKVRHHSNETIQPKEKINKLSTPRYSSAPLDFIAYVLSSLEETPIVMAIHSYTVTGNSACITQAFTLFEKYASLEGASFEILSSRCEDKGGHIGLDAMPSTDCVDELISAFLHYHDAKANDIVDEMEDSSADVIYYLALLFYIHTHRSDCVDLPFAKAQTSEDMSISDTEVSTEADTEVTRAVEGFPQE